LNDAERPGTKTVARKARLDHQMNNTITIYSHNDVESHTVLSMLVVYAEFKRPYEFSKHRPSGQAKFDE